MIRFTDYLKERDIAVNELRNMGNKLEDLDVVADFYCIPAENKFTYFAMLCKSADGYNLLFAKPSIMLNDFDNEIIYNFSFESMRKARNISNYEGMVSIGIVKVSDEVVESVKMLDEELPALLFEDDEEINETEDFYVMNTFFKGKEKTISFHDALEICGLSNDVAWELYELSCKIENIINIC